MCMNGDVEDALHFLTECRALRQCRTDLRRVLGHALPRVGVAGRFLLDAFDAKALDDKLGLLRMVAGVIEHAPQPDGAEEQAHLEQCGKAAWLFDKVTKNYLVRCWAARRQCVGDLKVVRGELQHTHVPHRASSALTLRVVKFPREQRRAWLAWGADGDRNRAPKRRKGSAHGFFVVWCGRVPGVKYKWSDTLASVAGFPGAKFRGFDDLDAAERAFAAGP